ncbi:Uncharacterized protein SCF082_LOCUS462 [Durusdinium trenchii]|uniref:ASCH domain-containing protein n=1 Tax=Durusdinium trenchii TaxID=1381693 RepID=A0ABP0H937_9DINO
MALQQEEVQDSVGAQPELPVEVPVPLRRLGHINVEDLGSASANQPPEPKLGDRVMVVKEPWLQLLLDGSKTMEIRGCKSRPGFVWIAAKGSVYGHATIIESLVLTPEEFRAREAEHRWPANRTLPYERLCGLRLTDVGKLPTPIPYWRPPAAVGWNLFRAGPEDANVKATTPQKRKECQENAPRRRRRRKADSGEPAQALQQETEENH